MKNKGALTQVRELLANTNHTYLGDQYTACIGPDALKEALAVLDKFIAGVPDDLGNILKPTVTYDNNGLGVLLCDDEKDAAAIKQAGKHLQEGIRDE